MSWTTTLLTLVCAVMLLSFNMWVSSEMHKMASDTRRILELTKRLAAKAGVAQPAATADAVVPEKETVPPDGKQKA